MEWHAMMRWLSSKLKEGDISEAGREARHILEWATERPFSQWVVNGGVVDEKAAVKIEEAADRRIAGEPWAYITGHREFYGLDLLTTPAALIPRPETELLVEKVLQNVLLPRARVADIGCGTGAIALALRSKRPAWDIFGVDISGEALELACRNSERLNLPVTWIIADLLIGVPGSLDAIVANLPYISPGSDDISPELRFEPSVALFADQGGLALIARLIERAPAWLTLGGGIFLECGWDQGAAVMELLATQGFKEITRLSDYAGHDRVISGRRS